MTEDPPLFILAGNGPYDNRGCEAIVRGTVKILREAFSDPRFVCVSQFHDVDQLRRQCTQEIDGAITHLSSEGLTKKAVLQSLWEPRTWRDVYRHYRNPSPSTTAFRDIVPYLKHACAVLSIGGDNYSLDYGIPDLFTGLDDLVRAATKPLVIWGASVGPFSAIPEYEQYMGKHLGRVTGIFARESASVEYLRSIGVTENVHAVADPAFLLDPVKPAGIDEIVAIEKDAIGLNLSPLMAKFVTGEDLEVWMEVAASIITEVVRITDSHIYLIPHVTTPGTDDYSFLREALSRVQDTEAKITVVPPVFNAAEIKWIIGQMTVFAGARTHSTIAALSSGVPTLSFAYSIKAQGINRDLFGHTRHCINPADMDAARIGNRISAMMESKREIRQSIEQNLPGIQASARNAGIVLKQLLGKHLDA